MLSKAHKTSSAQRKQIDLIIDDLQPIIHLIAVILRILQWKDDEKKYSLVCFLSLILFQSLHPYYMVLYCLPCALLISKIYYQNFDDATLVVYNLTEIHNSLYFRPTAIREWMQHSDTLCSAYQFYSISSKRMRFFIGVSCLFTIAYAGWVILSSLVVLTIIMCLHSPWAHLFQIACVRLMRILFYSLITKTTADSDIIPVIKNENQRGYRFEVYHHQRWWFPTGWSNLLLPQDRAVWTDAHLESTPSINNFCLPPKTTRLILENNQQKIVAWNWVDPEWSKHKDPTSTDSEGWQYGTWQWKQWSSQSFGFGICTRRQKWYRHAQRSEYFVDYPQQEQQNYCKTSCWDSQSTDGSSSGSSTISNSSSSSSPSGINTPVDSIIVSFDNKGERMLRRPRSSNLSNKSVTFNTTLEAFSSADAMYNKYCKSPVPQKFKRFI